MACDQVQTCLIFPLRWAGFPIKIGRNAQWEHLFSKYFDDFFTICLTFQSKSPFSMKKMISQWEHHISAITCDEGIRCNSTRISLFYFDDNFRRYSLWVRPLSLIPGLMRGLYPTERSLCDLLIISSRNSLGETC